MTNSPATCTAEPIGNTIHISVLVEQVRDAQVAYKLRDDIIGLIGDSTPVGIVLDLAKVTFIGSVGFLSFLGVRRHLKGGRIVLCNLSDPIREMFRVCRLIPTDTNAVAPFETANSEAEALSMLSA